APCQSLYLEVRHLDALQRLAQSSKGFRVKRGELKALKVNKGLLQTHDPIKVRHRHLQPAQGFRDASDLLLRQAARWVSMPAGLAHDRLHGRDGLAWNEGQLQIERIRDGDEARDARIDRPRLDARDLSLRDTCKGTQIALAQPLRGSGVPEARGDDLRDVAHL